MYRLPTKNWSAACRAFSLVLRVHRARQPVFAVVGEFERMLEVARLGDREHRAEDLFLEDARAAIDVGDHGRLDVVAVARRRPAAREQPPFVLPGLDVVEDRLLRALADHRSHVVAGLVGLAHPDRLDPFRHLGDELVVDRLASTMAREHAEHFCPWYPKADCTTPVTACSRSASRSTMMASLPPISATTRLIQIWPFLRLARPVR